jgi:hypothetical protein
MPPLRLNGDCWARLDVKGEECAVLSGHMYKGALLEVRS